MKIITSHPGIIFNSASMMNSLARSRMVIHDLYHRYTTMMAKLAENVNSESKVLLIVDGDQYCSIPG